MTAKTDQNERKRKSRLKLAAEKTKQEAHDKECGKQVLSLEFTAYRGTLDHFERLMTVGCFDDVNELITIMAKNASSWTDEDIRELLKI